LIKLLASVGAKMKTEAKAQNKTNNETQKRTHFSIPCLFANKIFKYFFKLG
jgi:hypothetical protein